MARSSFLRAKPGETAHNRAARPEPTAANEPMPAAGWYFDFVSPFAYLQLARFERLPPDLEITFRLVLAYSGNYGVRFRTESGCTKKMYLKADRTIDVPVFSINSSNISIGLGRPH